MRELIAYSLSFLLHAALLGSLAILGWYRTEVQFALSGGDPLDAPASAGSRGRPGATTPYLVETPTVHIELFSPVRDPAPDRTSESSADGAESVAPGSSSVARVQTESGMLPAGSARSKVDADGPISSAAPDSPRARSSAAARAELTEGKRLVGSPMPRSHRSMQVATSATASIPFSLGRRAGVDSVPTKLPTNPKPPWPPGARLLGIEGRVLLRVVVKANGRVGDIKIESSSGREDFDQSALDTVRRRWRFVPATLAGSAVEQEVLIPIRFSLRR